MRRALLAVLMVALLAPAAGEAAFPGANGKIAFQRAGDIWTMNPDGTGQVNLTNSAAFENDPHWSADGNRIAFDRVVSPTPNRQLYVMLADGTGVTPVTTSSSTFDSRARPAWSPAGDKLVFIQENGRSVATVNLNGTNETTIFFGTEADEPEWSPDGAKIVFTEEAVGGCTYGLMTMDPDGTDQAPLDSCTTTHEISQGAGWSPDGTRLAFTFGELGDFYLGIIDRDGTDRVAFTSVTHPVGVTWSPDGSKVLYATPTGRIKTVNPNGTNIVDLTDGAAPDWQPLNQAGPEADLLSIISDAPDPVPGGGILTYTAQAKNLVGPDDASGVTLTVNLPPNVFFVSASPSQGSCSQAAGVVTCNFGNLPEGSSATATIQVEPLAQAQGTITATANATANEADPIPGNNASQTTTTVSPGGQIRPKSASSTRVSLVPAYRGCDSGQATLTHGPPLAYPSCASPELTSGHLTLGTSSSGFAKFKELGETPINTGNGDQADVAYTLQLSDVRKASDLSDYTGELQAQATVRLTDRHSTPSGKAPATVTDTALSFNVPCTATAATNIGSTCSVSTSAEAVLPNMVQEGKRALWALGNLRVLDGGADGDAETGPNTLFAVQGVFVP